MMMEDAADAEFLRGPGNAGDQLGGALPLGFGEAILAARTSRDGHARFAHLIRQHDVGGAVGRQQAGDFERRAHAFLVPFRMAQRQRNEGSQQSQVPLSQFPLQLLRIGGQEAVGPELRACISGLDHFVEDLTIGLLPGPAFHFHNAPAHRGRSDSYRHRTPFTQPWVPRILVAPRFRDASLFPPPLRIGPAPGGCSLSPKLRKWAHPTTIHTRALASPYPLPPPPRWCGRGHAWLPTPALLPRGWWRIRRAHPGRQPV